MNEKVKNQGEIQTHEDYRGERILLALSKVSQSLQSARSRRDVQLKLGESIHELGFEATILSLNESGTYLTTIYQTRKTKRMERLSKMIGFSINDYRVPIRRNGILDQVVNAGQTVFLESRTEIFLEIFPQGIRSLIQRMVVKDGAEMQSIIAPLRFDEKVFGVIGVSGADLSEIEIPAITVFADQVSTAMMNAHAYKALQEREEEKFRIMFESAPDAYYLSDLKGEFLDGNKEAERITGYSKEELIGKSFLKLNLLPKNQLPVAAALLAKNAIGRSTGPDEFRLISKNGSEFNVEIVTHPVNIEGKTVVLGIARDITERKQAKETLQESEERYRTIFESVNDGIIHISKSGKIIDINDRVTDLFGYTRDEVIGKNFAKLGVLSGKDLPVLIKLFGKAIRGNLQAIRIWPIRHKNGTMIPVEASARLVKKNNKVEGLVTIIRDITERKRREQELLESNERFHRLSEAGFEGIVISDKGKMIEVNQQFADMFGYTTSELIGMSTLDLVAPESLELVSHNIRSNIEEPYDHIALRKNGAAIHVEVHGKSLPLEGRMVRVTAIRDITERKKAEEKLREQAETISSIVETSQDWIWAIDLQGNQTFSNNAIESILGYPINELIGKSSFDLMHEEDRQKIEEEFPGWISEKQGWRDLVIRWKHKDGTLRYLESSAEPTLDMNGQIVGFRGVDRDITERIQTEAALKNSESKYRNLVESSPDGIVTISKTGQILSVNESYRKLTGFEESDFVGKFFLKMPTLLTQDLDFYSRIFKDLLQGKTQGIIEFNWKHANGEIRNGEAKASILKVNDKIAGIQGIVRDITVRKKAEETLKRRLEELQILQQVSSICMENVDEHETIAQVTNVIGNGLYSDHFGIMLLDEERSVLHVHPSYQGMPENYDREVKLGDGVSGRVAKTNKSMRIDDIKQVDYYIGPPLRHASELCVPISLNGKVFGVINAEATKPAVFSESDERLLKTVADQLAVALQKSRLYQAEQKRRLEAEANLEASSFLTISLDLDEVLDNILDSLRKVTNSDSACVHLFQEDHIQIVAGSGFKKKDEIIGYKYTFENQIVVDIVNSKSPLVLEDAVRDPRFENIGHVDTRGWMGIPLIEKGSVFGILTVDSKSPGAYNIRDAKLVQVFANNAAAAIVKARLFEAEKKRRFEAEIQGEISATLTNTLDLQTALESTLKILQRYLEYDSAGILLEENGYMRIVATLGFPDTDKLNKRLVSKNHQLYQEILKRRSVLILENAEQDDRFEDFGAGVEIRGWMGVPLIDQGKVIGYVSFDSKTRGKFNSEMGRLAQVLVNQVSSAITKAKLFEETQLGLKRLEALHEIDRIITSSVELSFAIKQIMQIVVSQLELDAATVLMYNPNSLMFNTINTVGFHTKSLYQNHHQLGTGNAGRVALERQMVRVDNLDENESGFNGSADMMSEGFKTYLGVPLIAKGEIKGVLEIFHRSSLQTNNEWEGFLGTLATQLAIAIDNSQMFENLQKSHLELTFSYDATIEGWAKTLELRDQETQGHSERVTSMTVKLARALGMSEEDLIHVRRGALLHDVGKIGIPDSILQKPGQLTEDEWEIMRQHPALAYNVLSSSVFLEKALDIPYSHHEKWDGSGYPQGMKEEEIPIAARIFAIIDVYDALRSDRPYRKAWSKTKTVKHIKEQSESHFDPRVLEVFLELVKTDSDFDQYNQ